MFRVVDRPTFTHDVKGRQPVDGGYEDFSFKATFVVLGTDRIDELGPGQSRGKTDAFLREVFIGFDEIVQGDPGVRLSYSEVARDGLIQTPYVRSALVKTYFAALDGARTGN